MRVCVDLTLQLTENREQMSWFQLQAAMEWLETYPMSYATIPNTTLCLEKRVLWWEITIEETESRQCDSFLQQPHRHLGWKALHWVGVSRFYHPPTTEKIRSDNGLLKVLKVMGSGAFKHRGTCLAKVIWLVITKGPANQAGLGQSKLLCPLKQDKVPVVNIKIF